MLVTTNFKKKNTYFKTYKKGKYDGNQINMMALAVYLNYEKEMAKITMNTNLKQVSRFTWGWGYTWGTGSTPYKYAPVSYTSLTLPKT